MPLDRTEFEELMAIDPGPPPPGMVERALRGEMGRYMVVPLRNRVDVHADALPYMTGPSARRIRAAELAEAQIRSRWFNESADLPIETLAGNGNWVCGPFCDPGRADAIIDRECWFGEGMAG